MCAQGHWQSGGCQWGHAREIQGYFAFRTCQERQPVHLPNSCSWFNGMTVRTCWEHTLEGTCHPCPKGASCYATCTCGDIMDGYTSLD